MNNVLAWLLGVLSVITSGVSVTAIVYVFNLIIRVEVLDKLFNEKKAILEAVRTSQDEMDKRVTRVEDAVVALKEIVPELKKLGTVAQRLEILFDVKDERLNDLEGKVFGR